MCGHVDKNAKNDDLYDSYVKSKCPQVWTKMKKYNKINILIVHKSGNEKC